MRHCFYRKTQTGMTLVALLLLILSAVAGCDTSDTSDYYGPLIRYVSPSAGITNVSVHTSLSVLFNENVATVTVDDVTFTLKAIVGNTIVPVIGNVTASGNSASFIPDEALDANTIYLATLSSQITDVYSNPLDAPYSWYFTTGAPVNPVESFAVANIVLGQDVMTSGLSNQGGSAGAATLSYPSSAFIYNSTLYISDTGNNRVLGFANIAELVNGAAADFVLGQPDFLSAAPGLGSGLLSAPQDIAVYDGSTFAADTGNNRVLIWNSVALTNQPSADIAVGQPDLDTSEPGCFGNRLSAPAAMVVAMERLIVADTGNNRVLIWNAIPALSNTPADIVLGHLEMTDCAAGAAMANSLSAPAGLWTDGVSLAVADTGNNRVLFWSTIPIENGVSADYVIGQPDMTSSLPYVSAVDMNAPRSMGIYNGSQFFVADTGNNRVMAWDAPPRISYLAADSVLGQSVFYLNSPNDDDQDGAEDIAPSGRTASSPRDVFSAEGKVLIVDNANSRVLVINTP